MVVKGRFVDAIKLGWGPRAGIGHDCGGACVFTDARTFEAMPSQRLILWFA
jgi:hypothetical protein